MKRRLLARSGLAVVMTAGLTVSGSGAETVTYSYDALGRLIATATGGGPNSGNAVASCFDPAGNRSQYVAANGTASCSPAPSPSPSPSPSPTPTPSNTPPVAVDDFEGVGCDTAEIVNLTGNDTDADGDYPLTITAITLDDPNDLTIAEIVSASSVRFTGGPDWTEMAYFTYTITDSRGATDTGTVEIDVQGNQFSCDF